MHYRRLYKPTQALLIGVASVSLLGCASPSPKTDTAPLALCYTIPVPSVGETNESLARAFLAVREGLQVCQGVARAVDAPEVE